MSVSEDVARIGKRIETLEASLVSARSERRKLIVALAGTGLSERDVAALARCAPSFVHKLWANGK